MPLDEKDQQGPYAYQTNAVTLRRFCRTTIKDKPATDNKPQAKQKYNYHYDLQTYLKTTFKIKECLSDGGCRKKQVFV